MKLFLNLLLIFTAFLSIDCFAEENGQQDDASKKSYPGEITRDAEGTKVKHWSTAGPVKVSPPPEPFEDKREKTLPSGTFLNVNPVPIINGSRSVVVSQPSN